jgi:hypothetical protein
MFLARRTAGVLDGFIQIYNFLGRPTVRRLCADHVLMFRLKLPFRTNKQHEAPIVAYKSSLILQEQYKQWFRTATQLIRGQRQVEVL